MATHSNIDLAKTVDPVIKKHIIDRVSPENTVGRSIFTADSPILDSKWEKIQDYSDAGSPSPVGQGEAISGTSMGEGYETKIEPDKYATSIGFTKEELDDARDGAKQIISKVTKFSHGIKDHIETLLAGVLDNSFNTTDTQGSLVTQYANQESSFKNLFSTAHSQPVSGVTDFTNAYTAADNTLTESNLDTLAQILEDGRDFRGRRLNLKATCLLVPRELLKKAKEITGSDLRSDTGNNDTNFWNGHYEGGSLKVKCWDYLTDASRFYLIDERYCPLFMRFHSKHGITIDKPEYDKVTQITTWYVSYRLAYGFLDLRGIVGSLGNGSAYTD